MIEVIVGAAIVIAGMYTGYLLGLQRFHEREIDSIQEISHRDQLISSLNAELVVCKSELILQSRIDFEVKKFTHE
jgi:hypothetical protein